MKTKTVEIRLFGIVIYRKTTEHKCTVANTEDETFSKMLQNSVEAVIRDCYKAV